MLFPSPTNTTLEPEKPPGRVSAIVNASAITCAHVHGMKGSADAGRGSTDPCGFVIVPAKTRQRRQSNAARSAGLAQGRILPGQPDQTSDKLWLHADRALNVHMLAVRADVQAARGQVPPKDPNWPSSSKRAGVPRDCDCVPWQAWLVVRQAFNNLHAGVLGQAQDAPNFISCGCKRTLHAPGRDGCSPLGR
jgi:hypothetical protein